jgi:Protein of unknown function (DUF760)
MVPIVWLGLSAVAVWSCVFMHAVDAFHVLSCRTKRPYIFNYSLRSSVGGDDNDGPPSNSGGENRRGWEDFINRNENESESLFRAREYFSDNSLPISYEKLDDTNKGRIENKEIPIDINSETTDSSALVASNLQSSSFNGEITQEMQRNPYLAVVTKLSPSEIISKFTATAHPGVQNAVRSTILGLIGGLPKMAFETTTVTTGQKLASLMFQLQMTGYMFKVCTECTEVDE